MTEEADVPRREKKSESVRGVDSTPSWNPRAGDPVIALYGSPLVQARRPFSFYSAAAAFDFSC